MHHFHQQAPKQSGEVKSLEYAHNTLMLKLRQRDLYPYTFEDYLLKIFFIQKFSDQ